MTYKEAEKYLYSLEGRGWKLNLERIEKLLKKLDSPHHRFESIHIAGTNGKGSVAAMLESILHHAGYRSGLFTSPHLVKASERIIVSGKQIPKRDLTRLVTRIRPFVDSLECTFFETVTALAFLYFQEQHVEIAVVEVGLGGRFDATNVITPLLSIITDIDLDHTQHLGNDLSQIASEKAGIIKTGVPCLSKSSNPVVRETVSRIGRIRGAEIVEVAEKSEVLSVTMSSSDSTFDVRIQESVLRNITLPLIGKHQVENAQTALVAAAMLKHLGRDISDENLVLGLATTVWPGRCQKICDNPIVIIDAAHNPASIKALRNVLEELYPNHRKTIVLGVMADKDYSSIVAEIAPIAQSFVAVQAAQIRALSCETLAHIARKYTNDVVEFSKVSLGLDYALQNASSDSLICLTGSHYTIGEILADRKKYIDKLVKN